MGGEGRVKGATRSSMVVATGSILARRFIRDWAWAALEANPELLLFLHADCLPEAGALRRLRAAFEAPGLVAAGLQQRISNSGMIYRWIERAANRRVQRGMVFGDSGLAVRSAAYRATGGFTDQPLFEDVEFSRKLRRLGKVSLVSDAHLHVSARRWEQEGPWLCTLRNLLLRGLYATGIPAHHLFRLYAAPATGEPGG